MNLGEIVIYRAPAEAAEEDLEQHGGFERAHVIAEIRAASLHGDASSHSNVSWRSVISRGSDRAGSERASTRQGVSQEA